MIDARKQIKELLKSIEYENLTVKLNYPKTISQTPLITYFQMGNTSTKISVRDHISYQIDVWSDDGEECITLAQMVDEKMCGLGFKRDYASPDSDMVDASGYKRKILRYSSYVDTRTNRLIT